MKVPLALLGLGAGLLLLPRRDSALRTAPPGTTPFGPVPAEPTRRVVPPAEPPPRIVVVPAITIPPNGRHLTAGEKLSLSPFTYPGGLEAEDLDRGILWWGAPASSFASDDGGHIIALTTARGIYLRGDNHEIVRHDELATLGHELVHVGQFRRGDTLTKAEKEFPAYQMGLTIRKYLDEQAGTSREWNT